ncbi:MAG: hypothetical protein ACO1OC_06190 [Tuberibacillus sp.]
MAGIDFNRPVLLYFVCLLVGFALTKVQLTGTFLAALGTAVNLIGVLAILVFALVLLYIGVRSLINKNF